MAKLECLCPGASPPSGYFIKITGNLYDGHTLAEQMKQVESLIGDRVNEVHMDIGYRSHNYEGEVTVHVDKRRRGRQNKRTVLEAIEQFLDKVALTKAVFPGLSKETPQSGLSIFESLAREELGPAPRSITQAAITSICALTDSWPRTTDISSAEKTRSMSRIIMNCSSRLPIPLMKSVRI